ncbi:MAG: hypothetical protein QOJ68_2261, partial [Blastococcus sp.]|nr:hypothetical protein [Blastococcus sp.]
LLVCRAPQGEDTGGDERGRSSGGRHEEHAGVES